MTGIEVRLFRVRGGEEKRLLLFALYNFGDEKTQAVLEALNGLSESPIDIPGVLESQGLDFKEG